MPFPYNHEPSFPVAGFPETLESLLLVFGIPFLGPDWVGFELFVDGGI